MIAPIKAEELYDNPKVWFYHDVINDEKIETIKNKAASVVIDNFHLSFHTYFELKFFFLNDLIKA